VAPGGPTKSRPGRRPTGGYRRVVQWRRRARALWAAWAVALAGVAALAAVDPPWLDQLILPGLVLVLVLVLVAACAEAAASRLADRRDGRHSRAKPRRDLTWWERNRDALRSQRRRWLGPAAALVGAAAPFVPQSDQPRPQLAWVLTGLAAVAYKADVRLEDVAWRRDRVREHRVERLVSNPGDLRPPPPANWSEVPDMTPARASQWAAFVERADQAGRKANDDDF